MRPGGLTALAIFNFIFGGLSGLINLLGLATISTMREQMEESARQSGDKLPAMWILYFLMGMALIRAAVLITSGIGYLQLKRFLGYILGNIYAVLALIAIGIEIGMAPQNFTVVSLFEFVYPLITLFLLNVIFRKDFVR